MPNRILTNQIARDLAGRLRDALKVTTGKKYRVETDFEEGAHGVSAFRSGGHVDDFANLMEVRRWHLDDQLVRVYGCPDTPNQVDVFVKPKVEKQVHEILDALLAGSNLTVDYQKL